ncbi:hypothetical protein CLOM_g4442 [Closterium sp. NIES-68]|nr:hypothetical protein CLOM_g4442 [Closterium sp. NIES-68]
MVIVLEKELAAISMRPGDDVKPVLDKIKDTYARMAAAGSSVSQLQQCTKIISAEVTIMRGMGAPVAGGVPEWRAPAGTARRSGILGSSASAGRRDGHLQA